MSKIMTRKHNYGLFSKRLYATPFHALRFTPQVLNQKKNLIKLHNPGKFPEDSIFGYHFKDVQKLV